MKTNFILKALLAALTALSMAPAAAQNTVGGHDQHAVSDAAPVTTEQDTMPMTNHDNMDHSQMQGMDHGSKPMQSDPASVEARDPHAYSGGYTLSDGPYSMPGPRQLRLADEHNFGSLLVDRLERVNGKQNTFTAYDVTGWVGRDYKRLWLKAEGDYANGDFEETSTELLYGRAIANFWDAQLGIRYDTGAGPDRSWLAFGVQGLAPYWFELDATAYADANGRTAFTLEVEYELLLSQRLIFQPRVELSLHSKDDEATGIGRGLSDGSLGLRLRYEFSRQFAPYLGIEWARKFGRTADFSQAEGESIQDARYVAGVRFWF